MGRSSTGAGWYADPYQDGQSRYFDGTVWTHHVAPAQTAASTILTTAVLPAARHAPAPPIRPSGAPRRGTTVSRVLAISAITVGVLAAIGVGTGMLAAGLRSATIHSDPNTYPSGPDMVLTSVAPATVAGRTTSTRAVAARVKLQLGPPLQARLQKLLGANSATFLEIYDPPPTRTAGAGTTIVVSWAPSTTRYEADQILLGVADAIKADTGLAAAPLTEANGAHVICWADARPATLSECLWIRSGTGAVEMIDYGVPPVAALDDVRRVVSSLTGS